MSRSFHDRPHPVGPISGEALARLDYLLRRPLGCGVLLGPARSGKSALLRQFAESSFRSGAHVALVDGQGLDGRGLHWELAAQWRIAPATDGHGRRLAHLVRDFMHGAAAAGDRLATLIDHADRLEHSGLLAVARLLSEFEPRRGLTLIWTAESPLRGEVVDLLLPSTELRIDSPSPTPDETAEFVQETWRQTADVTTGALSDELADQLAALSRNDLRRAERLSRLSQLAALAEGKPLDHEMLSAVASELA